jgi:hypothetical protein
LTTAGKALLPVVVGARATERVQHTANGLADYLGRLSGATFVVETGDGQTGIVVGLPPDFPRLGLQDLWDTKDATRHEDYLLCSHARGLRLIGASDLAVEHAVWDLL